jgi:exodeoxyribonuclease V alpha subunit
MPVPPITIQPDREVIAGTVERVTFHNDATGFCMLRVNARGHRDLVTIVGHAATISAGEWMTATGEWVNDLTHGPAVPGHVPQATPPAASIHAELRSSDDPLPQGAAG